MANERPTTRKKINPSNNISLKGRIIGYDDLLEELKLDQSIVNTWGGATALGHPLGSSGSRLLGTLLSRLHTDDLEFGLATLCIGVGQGASMVIQRV